MAGKVTNCARFRESMVEAASGALPGSLHPDFDAHIRQCVSCQQELRRVQTLLQAIDETVSASIAAEPSPQLIANVRQRIAAQPTPAPAWRSGNAWLAAAGACAALAILLFVAGTLHRVIPSRADRPASPLVSLPPNHSLTPPAPGRHVESARTILPRKPVLMVRASVGASHNPARKPEIIVEPGQMQAILQLVAATQRGQIDGAKLLADEKKTTEPLEIEPLTIAPLQIAALKDESGSSAPDSSGDDGKNFVAGRSN